MHSHASRFHEPATKATPNEAQFPVRTDDRLRILFMPDSQIFVQQRSSTRSRFCPSGSVDSEGTRDDNFLQKITKR
jgi:hypothetical protein